MKEKKMTKSELIQLAYEELYNVECLNPFGDCCGLCSNGYNE